MAPLSSYGTTTVFKLIFLAGSFCRLLAVREQTRDGIGTGFKATFPGFQHLSNLNHKEIYLVFRAWQNFKLCQNKDINRINTVHR